MAHRSVRAGFVRCHTKGTLMQSWVRLMSWCGSPGCLVHQTTWSTFLLVWEQRQQVLVGPGKRGTRKRYFVLQTCPSVSSETTHAARVSQLFPTAAEFLKWVSGWPTVRRGVLGCPPTPPMYKTTERAREGAWESNAKARGTLDEGLESVTGSRCQSFQVAHKGRSRPSITFKG